MPSDPTAGGGTEGLREVVDLRARNRLMAETLSEFIAARTREADRADAAESRVASLTAERDRLLIAFHDAIRRPLGVAPDSGAEFYSYRMADEAEARRPRHGTPEERAERPEIRIAAALAALDDACRMSSILLMAGEMTAQERRTARAVANGITAKARSALKLPEAPDAV